jgi:hypothetical protein
MLTLREALSTDVHLSTIAALVTAGKAEHPELAGRMERACLILMFRSILPGEEPHTWSVESEDKQTRYSVREDTNQAAGACTCPDFEKAPKRWCKHRLALVLGYRAAQVERKREAEAREQAERSQVSADRAQVAYAEAHRPAKAGAA